MMKIHAQQMSNSNNLYCPQYEKDSCGIGFIANIKAESSYAIVKDALEMLSRMDHRGGCGYEENTGDGAGILTNIPYSFFKKIIAKEFNTKVEKGFFSVGNVFLPQDNAQKKQCMEDVVAEIKAQNQIFIGWRDVPTDEKNANIGLSAIQSKPIIKQLIIKAEENTDFDTFERKLYIIRKKISYKIRNDKNLTQALLFYICSLSNKVIVYKGMLIGSQVLGFYPDLQNSEYKAYLAMVHSRFSTNTFPSWDRAQPSRFMSHNGEINTRQGNINWITAREGVFKSTYFNDDELKQILPVIETEVSDSGAFDNVLEFMLMNGRSLKESILMMIPEAWQNDKNMDTDKKAFYEYFSTMMEPWDGPASIAFTDGEQIGAVLDRNGLRPSRYYLTYDDRVIMASEVGVVDVETGNIKEKGRLRPGKMFLIDFDKKKLIEDEQLKGDFAHKNPYSDWIKNARILLSNLTFDINKLAPKQSKEDLKIKMHVFGYTTEVMQFLLIPMVKELRDPLGSMGNDAALACLSDKPRLVYDYFKQLFAQVTNPPIDSIREEIITSLKCYIGPEANLLQTKAENAQRLLLEQPILANEETQALKQINYKGWKSRIIDITYSIDDENLQSHLDNICEQSSKAIRDGVSLIILSDRNINKDRMAVSTLLAAAATHQYLVQRHERTKIGLIVETAEACQVHHFCLLVGFGVDAINPYLAFDAICQAREDKLLTNNSDDDVINCYKKAATKGMLKVMAKMGISTLQSYKGAQIFEAVGLSLEVIDKCFYGVTSRIKGVGFDVLHNEAKKRHTNAYKIKAITNNGEFHWRDKGEVHMWNPETIQNLQLASKNNSKEIYLKYANYANSSSKNCTLRGLMNFKESKAINIDEVENAKEIVKRFVTGAMSFGSLSKESHESLAIAMNKIQGKSNSGEGGEDPKRWIIDTEGNDRCSAIKQVASGRFGVTIEYLNSGNEIQIKIAQGAKPGEGGELPGSKVDEEIAKTRHSTPGVGLISPPPHHDIYSIEDLAQLIFDLKHANPDARISVKLVAEIGVGTVAAGVTKAKADHIVISGHDGGTGASPITSIKHAGLPWELGLAETHQVLVMNKLRSRVRLQTDGQLKTGRDVAIAALLGAEEFGFSTAPLITLGCIMMRKCHLNTCPVGICTQDKELREKFAGKPEYVINYLFMVAEELRQIMAKLGFKKMDEMIGRVDKLEVDKANKHWKKDMFDLEAILAPVTKPDNNTKAYKIIEQDHNIENHIDNRIINKVKEAVTNASKINYKSKVTNIDRALGAMLSSFIVKTRGENNLADNTINIKLTGNAGQSLGGFLAKGVNIEVEGDANDYVGKGISGGRIIVYPPKGSKFKAHENIIAGNVCLYGAISGEVYLSGRVAERFCIRNSGATAVAEGIGDHGCEYMTGGVAVILGEVGKNFAAGMSGGVAYIYEADASFYINCNTKTVDIDPMDDEAIAELKTIIEKHYYYTNSEIAKNIVDNWETEVNNFIKIMPKDYKKVLQSNKMKDSK